MSALHASIQGLRLSFSAPKDFGVPLAVRGQVEVLREVIRDLLQRAIASFGRQHQHGMVRMTVRPTRQSVEISIEDNGRGLNEELVVKLEAKGLMAPQQTLDIVDSSERPKSLAEIRKLVEACDWKMHMQARLGVGARVVLELPRVDQDYSGVRIDRTREVLRAGTIVDPSVSLDGWLSASDKQLN
jgi:signal transduction histidine kinase